MPQMATQIITLNVNEDCRQILYHYYPSFVESSIPLKYWVKRLKYNIFWSDRSFTNIYNTVSRVILHVYKYSISSYV